MFNRSIGRSDLKGSCPRFQDESLAKLAKLPSDVVVYPGHGRTTMISDEKNIYRKLIFETKAESKYPAVAISSIIARYTFIKH